MANLIRLTLDPYDFVRAMLKRGETFDALVATVPMWDEDDQNKTPLTAAQLKSWYEQESYKRIAG